MTVIFYIVGCILLSAFYYLKVKKITMKEISLILLVVFAFDALRKTALTCFYSYDQLKAYFDDQTMAIIIIAMAFVTWLAIEPLYLNIKQRGSTSSFVEASDE